MSGGAAEGSIPSSVISLGALFTLLVTVHLTFSKLSRLGISKYKVMAENEPKTIIRSVLETIWAVGTGYLVGVLPT